MNEVNKILPFEYILKELLYWYKETSRKVDIADNDISILKALKLLFFVSASNSKKDAESILLDKTFNEFVAMPYGHVESEVYAHIRANSGQLTYFVIDNKKTIPLNKNIDELNNVISLDVKQEIDLSIKNLKENNPLLITMSAFQLVDLSHAWYSWRYYFDLANTQNVKSHRISPDVIKAEDKIYSLQIL